MKVFTFYEIAEATRTEVIHMAEGYGLRVHGNAPSRKIRERLALEQLRRVCVDKRIVD